MGDIDFKKTITNITKDAATSTISGYVSGVVTSLVSSTLSNTSPIIIEVVYEIRNYNPNLEIPNDITKFSAKPQFKIAIESLEKNWWEQGRLDMILSDMSG